MRKILMLGAALVAAAGCVSPVQTLEPVVIPAHGNYKALAACSYEELEKTYDTGLGTLDNAAQHHARVWYEGLTGFGIPNTVRMFDITFVQTSADDVRVEFRSHGLRHDWERDVRNAVTACQS